MYIDLYTNTSSILTLHIIGIEWLVEKRRFFDARFSLSSIIFQHNSVAKRHGADGTATAAGAAVYDFVANGQKTS